MFFTSKKRTGKKNVQVSGMSYFPRFIPDDEEKNK
jgi:hypothetical protein